MIKINDNWRIETGSHSWKLIFNEERTKIDKKTKKEVPYTFEDKWYFPCIKQAFDKYIQEDLRPSTSIVELQGKLNNIFSIVTKYSNTIFIQGKNEK